MCAQLCLTLCDPLDCSLQVFSIHGIFQAKLLEWVAISPSRGCSQPRDRTCVSCIDKRILYYCATWEENLPWQKINSEFPEDLEINVYLSPSHLQHWKGRHTNVLVRNIIREISGPPGGSQAPSSQCIGYWCSIMKWASCPLQARAARARELGREASWWLDH